MISPDKAMLLITILNTQHLTTSVYVLKKTVLRFTQLLIQQ